MDLSSLGAKGTLVTILVILAITLWAWYDEEFQNDLIFDIGAIRQKFQYYRLLSSGFIHADFFHLLFNLISFHSFAQYIERGFGLKALLIIFLGGIIVGDLVSLAWNFRNQSYRALGASGGVTAIVFANILLDPGESYIYMFMLPMPIPSSAYAVIYVLVSYYALKRNMGNVGHDAHLGGALAGIIAAVAIDVKTVKNHPYTLLLLAAPLVLIVLYELNVFNKIRRWLAKR